MGAVRKAVRRKKDGKKKEEGGEENWFGVNSLVFKVALSLSLQAIHGTKDKQINRLENRELCRLPQTSGQRGVRKNKQII